MTEREKQLLDHLNDEKEMKGNVEESIRKKRQRLKRCGKKINDLKLAIKEEQLDSIRDSMVKHGIDFEAFRDALEKGDISGAGISTDKKTGIKNIGENADEDENE